MATSSVIKFYGPVLFIIVLQLTRTSGAFMKATEKRLSDYVPHKFLVSEAHSNENFQQAIKAMFVASKLKFAKGPVCVKWWKKAEGKEYMWRYIMPEGPLPSELDGSGCIGNSQGRFCFCNQDKCSNGPILHVNKSSALQCYGCSVHPDMPAQLVQKEFLEENPPAEFLVNQTTARLLLTMQTGAEGMLKNMIMEEIKMRPAPFCVKVTPKGKDKPYILRHMMPEAPETTYLDESGCMENELHRVCFCNVDKCNNNGAFELEPENGTSVSVTNATSTSSNNSTSNSAILFPSLPNFYIVLISFVVVAAMWS